MDEINKETTRDKRSEDILHSSTTANALIISCSSTWNFYKRGKKTSSKTRLDFPGVLLITRVAVGVAAMLVESANTSLSRDTNSIRIPRTGNLESRGNFVRYSPWNTVIMIVRLRYDSLDKRRMEGCEERCDDFAKLFQYNKKDNRKTLTLPLGCSSASLGIRI